MRNLKGYAGRTAALIVFAALMAVAVFGGTLLIQGVRQGMQTTRARLGADSAASAQGCLCDPAKNPADVCRKS